MLAPSRVTIDAILPVWVMLLLVTIPSEANHKAFDAELPLNLASS
jgi:hypothetical protein